MNCNEKTFKGVVLGLTIKTTCLRGRVAVRWRADEINFGGGMSTTDVYDGGLPPKLIFSTEIKKLIYFILLLLIINNG